MIQRIQSLYLLIVIFLNAGMPWLTPLWEKENGEMVFSIEKPLVFGAFSMAAVLALGALFLFKKRKTQFVMGRLNILLNFVLLGFFIYKYYIDQTGFAISENNLLVFVPILSIVFLALANKAIKKDEDLVRSVDRLR